MRFSAAIRIGSMTTRPIRFNATDGGNGRCAIGAALDAIGATPAQLQDWANSFYDKWYAPDRLSMVIHMNDWLGFTREQIADVVEALENLEARNWEKPTKTAIAPKETALCH